MKNFLHLNQKSRVSSVQQNQHQRPGLNRTVLTAPPLKNQSRTRALTVNQIQTSLSSCLILMNGTQMGKENVQHYI